MAANDRHPIARCRWCGGFFVTRLGHWFCETKACADKQISHSILKAKKPKKGESPYLFLPLPLQVDMQTSTVKRLLLAGAGGASKSYGARWHIYSQCWDYPGYRALLLRCSFDELTKNHLQFIPAEAALLGDAKWSGGYVRQLTFDNGSMMYCGYCDHVADIPKHLGNDWDLIVFDEGVNFLPQALSEISARDRGSLTRRMVEDQCDGRTLIVTNPGGRAMLHLLDCYVNRTPDPIEYPNYNPAIYGFIPATLEDNPYLSANYASETLSGLTAARYRQLRYGDWTVFAGQFFEAFDPAIHVTDLEPAA